MRRLGLPTGIFLFLAAVYVFNSSASFRVHAISVLCLAVGYWLPSVLAPSVQALRRRWAGCTLAMVGSIFLWDVTGPMVVAKPEPLDILTQSPWAYVVGTACLGGIVVVTAVLGDYYERESRQRPSP